MGPVGIRPRRLRVLGALALTTVLLATLPVGAADPELVASTDTLVPLWTLGGTYLYWASLVKGAWTLYRKAADPAAETTLLSNTTLDRFGYMAADATGLFYYSLADSMIFFRPITTPFDPPTPVLMTDAPAQIRADNVHHLLLSGDHLYWIIPSTSSTAKIVRVQRDGKGLETVVDGIAGPRDLLVVGTSVYWLDNAGLKTLDLTTCGALPCAVPPPIIATEEGKFLLYGAGRGSPPASDIFVVYVVEFRRLTSPEHPERIVTYTCNSGLCRTAPLYAAASLNDHLGRVVTDGLDAYWPEEHTGSPIGGSVAVLRRQALGETIAPVDAAPGLSSVGPDLFIDDFYVYAVASGAQGPGIYRLLLRGAMPPTTTTTTTTTTLLPECTVDADCTTADPCDAPRCTAGICRVTHPTGLDGVECPLAQLAHGVLCPGERIESPLAAKLMRRFGKVLRHFDRARKANAKRRSRRLGKVAKQLEQALVPFHKGVAKGEASPACNAALTGRVGDLTHQLEALAAS